MVIRYLSALCTSVLIHVLILSACDISGKKDSVTVPDNEAPSVPSNLRSVNNQSFIVSLQWDASSDNTAVAGYQVFRDGSPAGASDNTTYNDTTVKAVSSYMYTVAAYDRAGNMSEQSEGLVVNTPAQTSTPTIIDNKCTDLSRVPQQFIDAAKSNLDIAFNHTSHGSQIPAGMTALAAYPSYGTKYQWSTDGSSGIHLSCDWQGRGNPISRTACDLGYETVQASGNTEWSDATRSFLNNSANNDVNVIIWSWCSIRGHDIDRYIVNMERLIAEYSSGGSNPRAAQHPVTFIFMTGHSEALGEPSVVATAACKIRAHCITNNRWLIDYYDLECYDPEGNFYGSRYVYDNLNYDKNGSKDANWAVEYCTSHPSDDLYYLTMGDGNTFPGCTSCAHSDPTAGTSTPREATLNCVLKARAAWWLFARLAGWDGK